MDRRATGHSIGASLVSQGGGPGQQHSTSVRLGRGTDAPGGPRTSALHAIPPTLAGAQEGPEVWQGRTAGVSRVAVYSGSYGGTI